MIWMAAETAMAADRRADAGLAFAPPFALENTLAGFQSAFYFLVLLLGPRALADGHAPRRDRARGSSAGSARSARSSPSAGGILTVAAIGGLVVLQIVQRIRASGGGALVNVAGAGGGRRRELCRAVASAPLPRRPESRDVAARSRSRSRGTSPSRGSTSPRALGLLWVPLIVVAGLVLVRRLRSTPLEQMSLALGAWVVIQAAALAYSRGVNGTAPASRYLDMLCFGFVVNTIALVWRSLALRETRRWRRSLAQGVLARLAGDRRSSASRG